MSIKLKITAMVGLPILALVAVTTMGALSMRSMSHDIETIVDDHFAALIDEDINPLIEDDMLPLINVTLKRQTALGQSIRLMLEVDRDVHQSLIAERRLHEAQEGQRAAFLKDHSGNIGQARNMTIFMVLGFVATVLALGAAVRVAGGIVKPMRRAVEIAGTISRGDLSVRLEDHSDDEVGQLMKALDGMVVGLKGQADVAEVIADGDLTRDVKIASDDDQLVRQALSAADRAVTDGFGDFKFDRQPKDSGAYKVEIRRQGYPLREVPLELGTSINLGEIRLDEGA